MSTVIDVQNVVKKYGEKTIIPGMSLTIQGGEFFTLLGPSGCGKTTLLRMIAGFNSIEGGIIQFNGQTINDLPAYRRNIGMVFQNYAIFPHMTVRQNIQYGLRQRRFSKEEINQKTNDIMEIVRISEYADRSPERLSGGQQQRVALARAIVIYPTVLLMDEPLSNLDAKLRVEMRSAIREIQKNVNITTVYVTHDQEEALAVSDRIAILKDGEIQQIAAPVRLYQRPSNAFVADFIGRSVFLEGTCRRGTDGDRIVLADGYHFSLDSLSNQLADGAVVKVAVRPEEFSFTEQQNGLSGWIKSRTFLGRFIQYEVCLANGRTIEISPDTGGQLRLYELEEQVRLQIDGKRVNVFTPDGSRSLIKGVNAG